MQFVHEFTETQNFVIYNVKGNFTTTHIIPQAEVQDLQQQELKIRGV